MVYIVIATSVLIRLFPHMPNFAPIGAMAYFSGAYLNKKYSIFIVLLIMLISDYLLLYINPYNPNWINFSRFHSLLALFNQSTVWVYGSFAVYYVIGRIISKRKTMATVGVGAFIGSLQFFLITNFGYWLAYDLYPKTFAGQMQAYVMALPFFQNTLLGDLFYTGLFFGAYALVNVVIAKKSFVFAK